MTNPISSNETPAYQQRIDSLPPKVRDRFHILIYLMNGSPKIPQNYDTPDVRWAIEHAFDSSAIFERAFREARSGAESVPEFVKPLEMTARNDFHQLPEFFKTEVYNRIYLYHDSPATDLEPCEWGKFHFFDSQSTFNAALQSTIRKCCGPSIQKALSEPAGLDIDQIYYFNHQFLELPPAFQQTVLDAYDPSHRNNPDREDVICGFLHSERLVVRNAIHQALCLIPFECHVKIDNELIDAPSSFDMLSCLVKHKEDLNRSVQDEPDFIPTPRPTDEEFKQLFLKLPIRARNYVYEMVYYLEGSPETTDLNWGEHHAFDDMDILSKALEYAIRIIPLSDRDRARAIHMNIPEEWFYPNGERSRAIYALRHPEEPQLDEFTVHHADMRTILEQNADIPLDARPVDPTSPLDRVMKRLKRSCGAIFYQRESDLPNRVHERALEIRSLLSRLCERYPNPFDLPILPEMRDPSTKSCMEVPLFDASHPSIQKDIHNPNYRHHFDLSERRENCMVCNHPYKSKAVMIDELLQERILNHLQAILSQPVEEVPTAPSGATFIAEALQMHSSTSTASEEIARAVVLRALHSTEPLTPLNTPEFMHPSLGLLESARKQKPETRERLIPPLIAKLKAAIPQEMLP
ncbi:MAG: hypothetical protein JSS61_02805 [Verrucomicrobia bacterium]|nr:hypothetical protein [Verrucomicrobiota bacterium]